MTTLPEGIESVHPHYTIPWRDNWMPRQADYVVAYITHAGAVQPSMQIRPNIGIK